eukprot:TRINITY_DN7974_c2_g1_i1.p1 TRINITY_DN7974_c2_g1~~TRINITY_DN7974_c2_g1_i1.p1  ORF type:complete len:281 (+),score=26.75 TRINITY_DN7974_c2_g1_i1:67-909(+)
MVRDKSGEQCTGAEHIVSKDVGKSTMETLLDAENDIETCITQDASSSVSSWESSSTVDCEAEDVTAVLSTSTALDSHGRKSYFSSNSLPLRVYVDDDDDDDDDVRATALGDRGQEETRADYPHDLERFQPPCRFMKTACNACKTNHGPTDAEVLRIDFHDAFRTTCRTVPKHCEESPGSHSLPSTFDKLTCAHRTDGVTCHEDISDDDSCSVDSGIFGPPPSRWIAYDEGFDTDVIFGHALDKYYLRCISRLSNRLRRETAGAVLSCGDYKPEFVARISL